jgi:2-methylcitrate dehydratase PrpD
MAQATDAGRTTGDRVSAAIVDWAARTTFDDLPDHVVERLKKSILDVLAVGTYGTTFPGPAPVLSYVRSRSALQEATAFLGHGRASAFDVALLNGTFVHTTEFAEGFTRARVHPGNSIIPGLLALAEREGRSGRDLLVGAALGYELNIRMGMSIDVDFSLDHGSGQGIHPPAMLGSIAAALACGKAIGFDAEGLRNALGIAATEMPSALNIAARQQSGVKDIYQGFNSALGVFAADLTAHGLDGLVDWVSYWYRAIPRTYDLEPIVDRLGEYWHTSSGGIRIKTRPVMGMCQPTTFALYDYLRETPVDHAQVEDILVESSDRIWLSEVYDVDTLVAARASIPFLAAAALVRPDEFTADYYCVRFLREELLHDDRIRQLARKVRLAVDPEFVHNLEHAPTGDPSHYMKFEARVTITMKDGAKHVAYKDVFAAGTGNMSRDDVARKFRACVEGLMPEERAGRVIDLVWNLERLGDAAELAALMGEPAA